MPKLDAEKLELFVRELFRVAEVPDEHAAIVAEHLVTSSMMGMHSHGLMRVTEYLSYIQDGRINIHAEPHVLRDTQASMVIDYGYYLGPVCANDAIDRAMAKAKEYGIACISARRSAHVARLGAYTERAAHAGFVALAFCNSGKHGHFVAPWGGREGRLATNPISFAIPTDDTAVICSDFSTAAIPEGKIRLSLQQKKMLPESAVIRHDGASSNDPADFYGPPRGAIAPFGGSVGYRGFALGFLVEVLGGLLGGTGMLDEAAGNGLGFILIEPGFFADREAFTALVREARDYVKSSPAAQGFSEVLMPGEPEFLACQRVLREGIELPDPIWESILEQAAALKLEVPDDLEVTFRTRMQEPIR
jgi:uncharacterized oxidoreductase